MTLDATLLNIWDQENLDVTVYLLRAEKARQLARLHIKYQLRPTATVTIFDEASISTKLQLLEAHRPCLGMYTDKPTETW